MVACGILKSSLYNALQRTKNKQDVQFYLVGLSSEPKAHLLILRGAARLAEGGEGESEDIKGWKRKKYYPEAYGTLGERNDRPRAGRLASVGSVGRFGACTVP